MCGIAGVVGRPGLDPERGRFVRRMTATLAHRGPDGEGFARLDGCDLGFRRLAIVDIDAPCPPFANEDQTVWVVCNGEIYNGDPLRRVLESRGHRFRTRVDTEVLPHLYEEHGSSMISRLDGMFAFAIWDVPRRRLILGRDRAGEKPLFYHRCESGLVFASELRALLAGPSAPRVLDPVALSRYLLHDYFPAPLTPLAGVLKLPAGQQLILEHGTERVERYWDLADHFDDRQWRDRRERDVIEELRRRLSLAVNRRKRSDAPVGVFLSGGLDSTTVLALLAEQEGAGVPTFALGHRDNAFDESRYAQQTARFFDADFEALVLEESDLEHGLQRVGAGLDEPLGDASTIPTHLLAVFARRKVKVILSGEGGDELFAGYPTYVGDRVAEAYRRIPPGLRRRLIAWARRIAPVSMGNVGLDYLLGLFAENAELESFERHHSWFGSLPPALQQAVLAPSLLEQLRGDDPFASARAMLAGKQFPDRLSRLLYMDYCMYLQDDLLTKVDRATMLASLEARAPFLDHELAQFVAGLPARHKLRGRQTKRILRHAMRGQIPDAVLRRRKRGFNIPFSRWLLHGLGQRLLERFAEERVRERGLFRYEGIRTLLDQHLSRQADHRKPLFNLLAFDLWCDRTFGESAAVPTAGAGAATVAKVAVP